MGKIILLVGTCAVGINPYKPYSPGGKFLSCSPGHLIRSQHIGTMIAREENDKIFLFEI
jgi:hypothetical protein